MKGKRPGMAHVFKADAFMHPDLLNNSNQSDWRRPENKHFGLQLCFTEMGSIGPLS